MLSPLLPPSFHSGSEPNALASPKFVSPISSMRNNERHTIKTISGRGGDESQNIDTVSMTSCVSGIAPRAAHYTILSPTVAPSISAFTGSAFDVPQNYFSVKYSGASGKETE